MGDRISATTLAIYCLESRHCEPLGTDYVHDPCQYFGMKKNNNPIESARTTVASVNREMQKPRLTESVRNGGKDQVVPIAKKPPVNSERA